MNAEPARVMERYARRGNGGANAERYSMSQPDVWQTVRERQRELIGLLSEFVGELFQELSVLEVGCGCGANLLELMRLGFSPANLVGNELLPDRASAARLNLPAACRVLEGDAMEMDIAPTTFDIVLQSTVFTSILDDGFQEELANKMWSWVKPGGGVLWYDFIYNNPNNPDVRGVPVKRVRQLFPHGCLTVRRVTLAPPIARRVCRIHPGLYGLFNAFPFLRTHVLCWIQK